MTMTIEHAQTGIAPQPGSQQLDPRDLDQLAELFRALSDRTRLNLLLLLSQGERNVTSLCEALRLPQPSVSHHLGLLRMNGLLASRRAGKQIYYGLDGRTEPSPSGLAFSAGRFVVRIEDAGASAEGERR